MILQRLAQLRLLPVVVLPRAELVAMLAQILIEERLPVIEITCRTAPAVAAIRALRTEFPDLLVGAGTVLSAAQVQEVVAAGAQFLLAPGFDAGIVGTAQRLQVPMIPGVMTPTEVSAAAGLNLTVLKLFPATALGGVGYLRTLAGVFPGLKFIPTGGLTVASLPAYLAESNVTCCGGSWLAPEELLREERWDEIRARVRAAVTAAGAVP